MILRVIRNSNTSSSTTIAFPELHIGLLQDRGELFYAFLKTDGILWQAFKASQSSI